MRASRPQLTPLPARHPDPVVPPHAGSVAPDDPSASTGRRWGGPILLLVGVLALLWAVPVAVDMETIVGSVGERVLLFLAVTIALGGCFPIAVELRRRRLRRCGGNDR